MTVVVMGMAGTKELCRLEECREEEAAWEEELEEEGTLLLEVESMELCRFTEVCLEAEEWEGFAWEAE